MLVLGLHAIKYQFRCIHLCQFSLKVLHENFHSEYCMTISSTTSQASLLRHFALSCSMIANFKTKFQVQSNGHWYEILFGRWMTGFLGFHHVTCFRDQWLARHLPLQVQKPIQDYQDRASLLRSLSSNAQYCLCVWEVLSLSDNCLRCDTWEKSSTAWCKIYFSCIKVVGFLYAICDHSFLF